MPEPAAISTCRPGTARSGVKVPPGACTSSASPGWRSCTSQPETAPPATSRTPIRGAAPGRRADRVGAPFLAAADGQRLPGGEREGAGQVGRALEGDRGRVVGERLDAGDGERVEVGASRSDRLHRLERLAAGAAAVQRLAGGGAELGGPLGVRRAAARAGDRRRARPASAGPGRSGAARRAAGRCRRRRASAALRGDPVGGPRRREPVARSPASKPARSRRRLDVRGDLAHRRAAAVGRGDRDDDCRRPRP